LLPALALTCWTSAVTGKPRSRLRGGCGDSARSSAAYYSWGLALWRHSDAAGAIDKLRQANKLGPHWADPLKAWGDVLAAHGHHDEAASKYDEALRYAARTGTN